MHCFLIFSKQRLKEAFNFNTLWTPIRAWSSSNHWKPSQKSSYHLEKSDFKSFRIRNLWIFYYKEDVVCMHPQRSWISFGTYLQLQSKYLLILTSSSSSKNSKKRMKFSFYQIFNEMGRTRGFFGVGARLQILRVSKSSTVFFP